jgi:hypothetical protein
MVGLKRMDLFLILTRFLGRLGCQDIIEFGSYRGGNALFMAWILRELYPQAKVYACDTYAGMPQTDLTRDAHYAGDFADTSQADLEARRDALGLTNLIVVRGRFEETFPAIAASGAKFALAHIDCDIYSAVKYAQEEVWRHRGGRGTDHGPPYPRRAGLAALGIPRRAIEGGVDTTRKALRGIAANHR